MKRLPFGAPCLLLALFVPPGIAAEDDLARALEQNNLQSQRERERVDAKLDPKRIINQSNSFLREREPEMNAEEYALYEKVVVMLGTNPQFALRLLEAMMNEKDAPSPAFEFILGNAYYAAGENAQAEARYRNAVKRFPSFVRAWSNLGVLYYSTERYADAVPCFSQAIVLGDRTSSSFGLLGYSLEKTGNLIAAEMAYMQALGGEPRNASWQEGLLRIYLHGRQFGRAESLVKNLIKDDPAQPRFWLVYANILLAQSRKLEAITVLELCASTRMAGPDEHMLLGDLYAEQGLIPEAIGVYQQTLGAIPQTGERRLLRFAQVLTAGRRLDEAESVLAAMTTGREPQERTAFLQAKADLRLAQQRPRDARALLDELLKLSPLDGRALLGLGNTYLAEEDLARAALAFEAALRSDSTRYRACLELANLELRLRHYSKSVEYLEQALGIQKSDEVEDYLARIKTLVGNES